MTTPLPMSQAGFSEQQKLVAIDIRTRIQNGENIPLEELRKFILAAEKDLDANRVKANKPPAEPKKSDVDFF